MTVGYRVGVVAAMSFVISSAAGCIAPDVDVVGALGVTVDTEQRPIVVVEACEGAAAEVDLFLDREGLANDEENERVATWVSDAAAPGTSQLVLHAPASPWAGEAVEVTAGQGYVATAAGEGDREVLSQVAFGSADLADMRPGTVYTNDVDPDVSELVGRSAEEFTDDVCSRG